MSIFLKESESLKTGKGYISLKLDHDDAKLIHTQLDIIGIKNLIPTTDMHITLIYDASNPIIKNYSNSSSIIYKAKIVDAKPLGDNEWKAITFILDSPEISKRHEDLKGLGFKHSYPEFIAHLSLKYKPTEEDMLKIKLHINRIKQVISTLHFSCENLEVIK